MVVVVVLVRVLVVPHQYKSQQRQERHLERLPALVVTEENGTPNTYISSQRPRLTSALNRSTRHSGEGNGGGASAGAGARAGSDTPLTVAPSASATVYPTPS